MSLVLNGTDGLSDVDGSAATPAIRGTDTDTGVFFPAANTMALSTGGTEQVRIDSSGNLLVGTTTVAQGLLTTLKKGTSGVSWGVGPDGVGGTYYVLNNSGTGVALSSGNTSWSAISDERVKTSITPFENSLEKICSIRAGTGRYLTDNENISRSFLIAQDVQKILPEAIDISEDENKTLQLRYTDVIPLLVASIKELKATVDAQAARITALESAGA
jgi:hypothetical protein